MKKELQYIKGIGPKRYEAFVKEGLKSSGDFLYYFPRDYIDRTNVDTLKSLAVKLRQETNFTSGSISDDFSFKLEFSFVGRVTEKKLHTFGKNRQFLKLVVNDLHNGSAEIIFWNYAEYYAKLYELKELISVSGKPELNRFGTICFNHPEIQRIDSADEKQFETGKILPIYKLSDNLKKYKITSKTIRDIISIILPDEIKDLNDTFPEYILKSNNFPTIQEAIKNLHFPDKKEDIEKARQRMKFEEIFFFELLLAVRQRKIKFQEKGLILTPKSKSARKLYNSLPFKLTKDQIKVINEITDDMQSGKPMNRLLQGDVGSGKTIVALLSMLVAVDNGFQAALMAPTELLAEQHYHTISNYLKEFDINVVQLVGGQKKRVRQDLLEKITSGEGNIIVGTHALFESEILYKNLGLIIIDEQHRFGVAQRAELITLGKKSHDGNDVAPHILVMSATPIPRTLSMTLYGDLDVSIIREMPKNRKPVKTKVVFESQLPNIFNFIREEVKKGRQAFIVYPLVEKSEKLDLKSATEHYEQLRSEVFPDLKCGLLHGQMFWYEKDETMHIFLEKKYDILVATTVIEVGIDIPNATIMLIENSERFGLSQLHQLRGRVGRGSEQSYCILATKENFKFHFNKKQQDEQDTISAIIRLKSMEETSDGFKISEIDLKLRGPGDFLGTKQAGLPSFKFINLASDGDIVSNARKLAFEIIAADPHLRKTENQMLREHFIKLYKEGNHYFDIA